MPELWTMIRNVQIVAFFHFSDPEDSKTVYHSPKHLLIEGLTSVICSTEIQSMYPCWNEKAIVHNHQ